jgi:hypothetical protein
VRHTAASRGEAGSDRTASSAATTGRARRRGAARHGCPRWRRRVRRLGRCRPPACCPSPRATRASPMAPPGSLPPRPSSESATVPTHRWTTPMTPMVRPGPQGRTARPPAAGHVGDGEHGVDDHPVEVFGVVAHAEPPQLSPRTRHWTGTSATSRSAQIAGWFPAAMAAMSRATVASGGAWVARVHPTEPGSRVGARLPRLADIARARLRDRAAHDRRGRPEEM